MGDKTGIEWTKSEDGTAGATWTPVRAINKETGKVGWFCEHATPGCEHCYAEELNRRFGTGIDFTAQNSDKVSVVLDHNILLQPLRWRRPRKIFVCSMTDLFGRFVDDDAIDHVFAVMALAPQHVYQILTKRDERLLAYIKGDRMGYIEGRAKRILRERSGDGSKPVLVGKTLAGTWPWPHVWLGVSVEDARRKTRIANLRSTPAAVRFLSIEPLISDPGRLALAGIDWVIVGGESGAQARPVHPDWVRSIRDQCEAQGVAFFFKQWGEFRPTISMFEEPTHWLSARGVCRPVGSGVLASDTGMIRAGKKLAGRTLDGRTYDAFPPARIAA